MIIAGVSWNGKTYVHFIDTEISKVNSDNYIELLRTKLLPDCSKLYCNNIFIFQQDGAPSHTSHATQSFLTNNVPNFIAKNEWPPQSPDCNPMDYAIWESLKEKVYRGQRKKFPEPELKRKILESWQEISIEEIRKSISIWKKRLRTVCEQHGNPIDHLM